MKYFIYIVLIFLLVGASAGGFSNFKILGAAPNLFLVMTLLLSLKKDNDDVLWVAFVSGLALDMYAGVFVGSFALGLLLLSVCIKGVISRLAVDDVDIKYLALTVVLSTLFVNAFVFIFNRILVMLNAATVYPADMLSVSRLVSEIFYNMLLLYPMYRLVYYAEELVIRSSSGRRYMR